MLFHVAVGLFSAKYAYGFGSAWKGNTETTSKAEFFSKAFHNADAIGTDAKNKVSGLFISLIPSSKKPSFQNAARQVINANKKTPKT
ncbi:MAG: hypothetical protein JSS09_06540 [Verrucomicrobia bacterium]|nr:hypothetical protein [Verrucomicrobiota bacterium]